MDESVEISPVENKKSNKKKIILIILGVVLALTAGILCFLLLSKKPAEGAFKEKKYYFGQSTLNVAGPLGTYMFFDTNGTYISTSTTLGRPSGSIGTYKIDGETIYLSTEYYYEKNEDEVEVKIASSVGEGTIKNDIITLESYEFKPISSSEYKKVSKEKGYYTYKDIKNAYGKENRNDEPVPTPSDDVDEPTNKELPVDSSIIDGGKTAEGIKYTITEGDYFYKVSKFTIGGTDVTKYFENIELGVSSVDDNSDFSIKEFDDFYIISISSESTCGYGENDLYVFDKTGKVLLSKTSKDTINNDLSKLVYHGSYKYENKKLVLSYGISCDVDCNVCEEFYDASGNITCENRKKYSDSIIYADYESSYLGNGKFSEFKQISKTLLKEDTSKYGYKLDEC